MLLMRLKIKHDSKYEAAASLSIIVELVQFLSNKTEGHDHPRCISALFSNKLVTSETVTTKCIDLHVVSIKYYKLSQHEFNSLYREPFWKAG